MSEVRRHLKHALTTLIASSLVAGVLVGLGTGPADAAVPKAGRRYTAAIEPLARYVGQSTCSPAAKPGTTAFANLLLRTYPHSRSLGISRACNVGGTSEHKEGRAFDWGVSVNSARDRRSVKALMHWLLKKDRYGNRHAMARRLGIQYMIWNRRIWGSYAASSGWRKYTGSNPHTDHVHFSLSWAGARKKTSFWSPRDFPNSSGSAPSKPKQPTPDRPSGTTSPTRPSGGHYYPDPTPDERRRQRSFPEPRAPRALATAAPLRVERFTVATNRRAGTRTGKALVAGHRYLIEVSGRYRYAKRAGSFADAECSTSRGSSWWQRDRSLRSDDWYADHLDLYVDGHDLWAQADDGSDCDDDGHMYRWVYEAERSGRAPFAVWDPQNYKDNRGRLTVRVLDLSSAPDTMSWRVPSRAKAGATSPGLLREGEDYLITVRGTWRDGQTEIVDAECALTGDGTWRREADDHDMVAGAWGYDSLSPRLAGVRTLPAAGGDGCDPEHTYSWVQHVDRTSPLNVRVSDPGRFGDNRGALRVTARVYDGSTPGAWGSTSPSPSPSPSPSASPTSSPSPSTTPSPSTSPTTSPSPTSSSSPTLPEPKPLVPEELKVDSASASSVRTSQLYPAGTKLRVTASGTYFMKASRSWVVADAECTIASWDTTWRSQRFDGMFDGSTSPLGDLAVNGQIITWVPSDGRGSCDQSDHVYTYDLTTTKDGPLRFVVADDDYSNNRGTLEVTVEAR